MTFRPSLALVPILLILGYPLWGSISRLNDVLEYHFWAPIDCTVQTIAAVLEPNKYGEYALKGTIAYEHAGQKFVSATLVSRDDTFRTLDVPIKLEQQFRSGIATTCFVNPQNPTQAVLIRTNYWGALNTAVIWLLVMGTFVAGAFSIKPDEGKKRINKGPATIAVLCLALFLIVFGLIGVVNNLWLPLSRWYAASSWTKLACTVEHSELNQFACGKQGLAGCDVPNFSLIYSYQIAGATHRSARYDLVQNVARRYASGVSIVNSAPVGKRFNCYADPKNPLDAVINRNISMDYFIGIWGLGFVVVGCLVSARMLNRINLQA